MEREALDLAVSRMNRWNAIPMAKYRCEVCGWQWWQETYLPVESCWRCREWLRRPEIKKAADVLEVIAAAHLSTKKEPAPKGR